MPQPNPTTLLGLPKGFPAKLELKIWTENHDLFRGGYTFEGVTYEMKIPAPPGVRLHHGERWEIAPEGSVKNKHTVYCRAVRKVEQSLPQGLPGTIRVTWQEQIYERRSQLFAHYAHGHITFKVLIDRHYATSRAHTGETWEVNVLSRKNNILFCRCVKQMQRGTKS